MWQIPSVAIAVSSGVFAVAFTYVHPLFVSGVMLLFGAFFDLTLTVALTKHRLSIDLRTAFLRRFEEKFGLEPCPVRTRDILTYLGSDYEHATHPLFRNLIAFQWMFRTLVLLVVIMVAAGFGLIILQFV